MANGERCASSQARMRASNDAATVSRLTLP
jgi:hypothetical protein